MFSVYAGNAQSSCPVVGAVTGCSTHARLRHWNFDPRNCCASVDWSMSEHSATDAAPVWWGNSDGSQWPDVRQRSGSTQPHNPAKMVQVLGLLKIRLRQLHWLPVHLKRNFKYLQLSSFIFLYKNMVRSNLDYCSSVWTPYRKGDIEDLEKVQKGQLDYCVKSKNLNIVIDWKHVSYLHYTIDIYKEIWSRRLK